MLESTSVLRADGPEIGVLGTGRMGTRLAAMFARAGRRVILASRTPSRAAEIVAELSIPSLAAGSYSDALQAPAILPAIFIRDGLLDLVEQNVGAFEGKLVIDISNPFNDDYSDFLTPCLPPRFLPLLSASLYRLRTTRCCPYRNTGRTPFLVPLNRPARG